MILADTSVWIQHFRYGHPQLQQSLMDDQILMHPMVWGEIACGNLRARSKILEDLRRMPSAMSAQHEEVLAFVEQYRLFGKGINWIDANLLASARLTGCRLWTLDAALRDLASEFKIGYSAMQ
jgi:predicted nucleic acid-binding protein